MAEERAMAQAERIQAIAEDIFGPRSPHHRAFVAAGYHLAPDIPEKKLVGACEAYAQVDFREEDPLVLMDDTVFGSGKRGFVITTRALHYNITNPVDGCGDHRGRLPLEAIREFRLIGDAIYVNGQKVGSFHHPPEGVVLALETFFRRVGGEDAPDSREAAPPPPDPVRATTREAILETLRALKGLHEDGVLTEAEFAGKKRELLDRL